MAQTADAALVVSLEARVDQFEKAFNRAGDVADRKFSPIEKRTKEAGDKMREQLGSSVEGVNKIFETIGIGLGLNELREMADAFSTLTARVNEASGSAEKGAEVWEKLVAAAQRSRTSVDATVGSYLKMHDTMEALGASTSAQIKIQEALNDTFKLSGTTASDAASVQNLLLKVWAEGTISAKQLGEVITADGRAARVFATALGTTVPQLKLMADMGKLDTKSMLQGLIGALPQLRTELAGLPETISDAMVRLKDALSEYVGNAAQATGITTALTGGLNFLADHMDAIGKSAAVAGAAILAGYIPSMLEAAAAGAAMTISNPFLLIASAAAAAALAAETLGDKIKPIAGDMATLKDYSDAFWTGIRNQSQTVAQDMGNAFIKGINSIISALNSGEADTQKFGESWGGTIVEIIDGMVLLAEITDTTLKGLSSGLTDLLNSVQKFGTELHNLVVDLSGIGQKVAPTIVDDPYKMNDSLKLLREYKKEIEDYQSKSAAKGAFSLLSPLQEQANENATDRQKEPGTAAAGTDTAGIINPPNSAFEKTMRDEQQKLATLQAETAARRAFSGTLEEEEAASKRAEIAQTLLNEAQKAGVAINDEVISRIADLADAYSRASSEAAALAKTQQEAEARTKDLESTGKSAMSGFVEDLAHGKTAAEALKDALTKLSDKFLNLGMDALWKSMMNNGGNGVFAGISKLFDTGEEKPAYAPGSSLGGLKTAAANTAHMSVTAGTVTVTGGTAPVTPVTTSALPDAAHGLPDHPHTPTPGSQAGYVDPWMAAFKLRDQAKAASSGRQAAEAYYGKPLTDSEYKSLTNATSAEASGGAGNPQEQAMITASILNRAKTNPGGIEGALHAPNQFQSVTGTAANGHQPSAGFVNGPDAARLAQIENANKTYLSNVSPDQTNFTANDPHAYGAGTDIGYRNGLLANGGTTYGGSVFNTALPNQIPDQLSQTVTPQLTTFTQSLTKADTGLGQFSGGLGDAIKGLLGGLGGGGGGGGGLGGILSGVGGLFGFADGGMINGAGSGTSDSNLAAVSDGEFIVNAGATTKNKALLTAINSGKAPKFGASVPSVASIVNSKTNDASVTNHNYVVNNNINTPNADSFRRSSGQIAADANVHIQRMGLKNG